MTQITFGVQEVEHTVRDLGCAIDKWIVRRLRHEHDSNVRTIVLAQLDLLATGVPYCFCQRPQLLLLLDEN